MTRASRWIAAVLALAVVAAACGDDSGDDESGSGDVADAPGFDGETIRIGVISDLSGPAAVIGEPLTAGGQVYYDYINSQGGVAGQYLIETDEGDSQYNQATAVQVYNDMKDDVVLFGQLFGTPITNAVLEQLRTDGVLGAPASLDAAWVRDPNLLPVGAPYQIQAINGFDWWINEDAGSADQVYCTFVQDDPYGEAGQEGAEFAADKLGFTITDTARFVSGDTDFSAQIRQLEASGCEVVFLVATPSVTGAALGEAASGTFAPTWIGQSPTWINSLVEGELVDYLEENFIVVNEGATWGDEDEPGMVSMTERLAEFAPDQAPDYYFTFGYNQAAAVVAVLEQAVADGDLSREGILAASEALGTVSFDGLAGDYVYGAPEDRQPGRESTIFRVNPDLPTGLEAEVVGYESEYAVEFEFD